jgi:hypothetical protein
MLSNASHHCSVWFGAQQDLSVGATGLVMLHYSCCGQTPTSFSSSWHANSLI